jgi:hypothetical protein
MSLLVLPIRSNRAGARSGSGIMLRMRAWIAAFAACGDDRARLDNECKLAPTIKAGGVLSIHSGAAIPAGHAGTMPKQSLMATQGAVVPFPRSSHTQLIQLARNLKRRFVSVGLADFDPFVLRVESGTHPRLWIDDTAYVESRHGGYRVVLENAFDARITIETCDFDSIAAFVGHYIVARLSGPGREGDLS